MPITWWEILKKFMGHPRSIFPKACMHVKQEALASGFMMGKQLCWSRVLVSLDRTQPSLGGGMPVWSVPNHGLHMWGDIIGVSNFELLQLSTYHFFSLSVQHIVYTIWMLGNMTTLVIVISLMYMKVPGIGMCPCEHTNPMWHDKGNPE